MVSIRYIIFEIATSLPHTAVTGGLGNSATAFYKRLASMLALKWDQPYNLIATGYASGYIFLCCTHPFKLFMDLLPVLGVQRQLGNHQLTW